MKWKLTSLALIKGAQLSAMQGKVSIFGVIPFYGTLTTIILFIKMMRKPERGRFKANTGTTTVACNIISK